MCSYPPQDTSDSACSWCSYLQLVGTHPSLSHLSSQPCLACPGPLCNINKIVYNVRHGTILGGEKTRWCLKYEPRMRDSSDCSSQLCHDTDPKSGIRREAAGWCWCCAVLVSRKWSGKMFSPALMLSQVTLLHVTLRHKSHWYTWHNIDHSRPPISYFCACLEGTLPYSAQFDSVYLLGAVTHWRGRGAEIFFPAEAPVIIDLQISALTRSHPSPGL